MKLSLPLFIMLPKLTKADKKFFLNLNGYRNINFRVLHEAKVRYKEEVREALFLCSDREEFGSTPLRITYTFFPPTKRRTDLQNVCTVVSKFAEDALVCLGVFDDDDYKIIAEVNYRFGHVDKKNPRCDVEIERLK